MKNWIEDRYVKKSFWPLFLGDFLASFAAWIVSYFVRFFALSNLFPVPSEGHLFWPYSFVGLLVSLTQSAVFAKLGGYDAGVLKPQSYYQKTALSVVFCTALWFSVLFFVRSYSFSRLQALIFILLNFLFLFLVRRFIERLLIPKAKPTKAVILGSGAIALKIKQKIEEKKMNLDLVGFLSPPAKKLDPWLGDYADLARLVEQLKIEEVFVALSKEELPRLKEVEAILYKEMVDILWVLDTHPRLFMNPELLRIQNIPVLVARQNPIKTSQFLTKRVFDLLLTTVFFLVSSPLWVIIPLLIKLTSKGPVFYKQTRMGLDGKVFGMYKFRSMRQGAEKDTGAVWAKKNDPRVTALGSLLRKTSLDEIPQFLNVLKGDMSLVGPRPERPELIEKFKQEIPFYMSRHKIKAGITGWAQINGLRGDTSLEKRIDYDLYYIQHWSLWFDGKILLLTFIKGFISKNAY